MKQLIALCLLCLGAAGAAAETPTVHFSGYGRETGHFEISAPGDTLWLATHITSIDDAGDLPYDPVANEYTLVIRRLISPGEVTVDGVTHIDYQGGRLEVYADPSFNSDWMNSPIGSEPPASFCDGELWLAGGFVDFSLTAWRDFGMGIFEGSPLLDGGSALPAFPDGMLLGGTTIPAHPTFAEIGYDLACDGELWLEAVGTASSSLGAIKALY